MVSLYQAGSGLRLLRLPRPTTESLANKVLIAQLGEALIARLQLSFVFLRSTEDSNVLEKWFPSKS